MADQDDRTEAEHVRHRFKNYQQMILSLVKLQARRAEPGMADTLQDLLTRIEVAGLVNEGLADAEAPCPLDQILPAVAARVSQTLDPSRSHDLSVSVPRAVIDGRRAGILAQLLAELLLNAYRHGASGREGAAIAVALTPESGGWRLTVTDDGPGWDANGAGPVPRLGLLLSAGLARNLAGTLTHRRDGGAVAEVHFPA